MSWEDCLQYAALSDVGMRRANNQDSFAVMLAPDVSWWRKRGHLFIVADGMGAHAAGELASKMACDAIPHTYSKSPPGNPAEALRVAIADANRTIHNRGQSEPEFQGMGTTCSALLLLPEGAVVGHVGDSRVYRLRGGRLDQLSFDHSLVWEMKAAGRVATAKIEASLPKNIITRSLGPNEKVQVDLEGPFPVAAGDRFLLCSDGLSGPVTDKEIGALLASMPPQDSVQALIDLANLRGGPDNITAIVLEAVGPPLTDRGASLPKDTTAGGLPWLPIAAAAALFLAVGLFFAGQILPAIGLGLLGVVMGIVAVLQRFSDDSTVEEPSRLPGPLGRGPHTSMPCKPDLEVVQELAAVSEQLRGAAEAAGWDVEWSEYQQARTAAEAAAEGERYKQAVASHCAAISHLMNELRKQRKAHKLSDSHVDLI